MTRARPRRTAVLMATIALTLAAGCTRPAGSTGRTATGRDSIPFGFGPPTATGRRPTPQGRPVDEAYVMPRIVASRTAPVTLYASDGD